MIYIYIFINYKYTHTYIKLIIASSLRSARLITRISYSMFWWFLLDSFVPQNWGMLLCCAGIMGGVFAGVISDRVFGSRRGPVAGILYAGMLLGSVVLLGILRCVCDCHLYSCGPATADLRIWDLRCFQMTIII